MIKRAALLFLCAAIGVSAFVILDMWRYENLDPMKKLQQLWEDDVEEMQASGQLPAAWNAIAEIELTPGDELARQWLKHLEVPVFASKDGRYKLQVMLVTWNEDGKMGAYIQYDLTDLKANQNTIWENARTFILLDKDAWEERYFRKPRPVLKTSPRPSVGS